MNGLDLLYFRVLSSEVYLVELLLAVLGITEDQLGLLRRPAPPVLAHSRLPKVVLGGWRVNVDS